MGDEVRCRGAMPVQFRIVDDRDVSISPWKKLLPTHVRGRQFMHGAVVYRELI